MNPVRCLTAIVAVLVVACSAQQPPTVATPDLSGSFVQFRPDEGTERAHLRLTNRGDSPLDVSGVAISWAGYADQALTDADTSYAPGQTIDLPLTLPRTRCSPTRAEPEARVEVAGEVFTIKLDASGATALREVWEHACSAAALDAAVTVEFGRQWQPAPGGLRGTVVAHRGSSGGRIEVVDLQGSVLLSFRPVDGTSRPVAVMRPGDTAATFSVVLASNGRCDAHALGESKQTFLLRVVLTLDRGEPQPVVVSPDQPTQQRLLQLIRAACGVG